MKFQSTALAVLVCASAQAQPPDLSDAQRQLIQTPMNTYRFIGGALLCKSDSPVLNPNQCNRIGATAIGDDWGSAAARLGPPSRVIPGQNGVTVHVYFRQGPDGAQAYWVLEKSEARNKVVAIQVTGHYKMPGASFSTIELTDSEDKVRQLMGPRFASQPVPSINGMMWDYAPFRFSFQFVNGRVYSIRVSEEP